MMVDGIDGRWLMRWDEMVVNEKIDEMVNDEMGDDGDDEMVVDFEMKWDK